MTPPSKPNARGAVRILLVVGAILAFMALGRLGGSYLPAFVDHIRAAGAMGPVTFVLGYIIAMVAGVPASLLTLAAGAVFGLWHGVLFTFIGATAGACAAFLVSRYAARNFVLARIGSDPRFNAIDRAIATDGRRLVFLLRLSPAVPFTLLNYLLGLTRVRLVDFVVGSVGMLPATFLWVYSGKLAGDVATIVGGGASPKGTTYYAILALGLAATVMVTVLATRAGRRALHEQVSELPANEEAGLA